MTNEAPGTTNTKIPMQQSDAALEAKKKMANLIMIVVIVAFAGAGLMMIPSVRETLLGGGSAGGGGTATPAGTKPGGAVVWDKPRDPMPVGQFTQQLFGKAKPYTSEGRGVQYYLHSPVGAADSGQKYPLVIFLHDEKGLADGALTLLSKPMQQQFPAYILIPMMPATKTWAVPEKYQGQEFTGKQAAMMGYWSPAKFPAARQGLRDALNITARLLTRIDTIDDGRIYVAGCGEGALGVYGAMAKYPDFIAGGVAVSGFWSFLDGKKMKNMPLVVMHGAKDTTIPVTHAQMMAAVIQQMGGQKVIYNELPDLARNCSDQRLFTPSVWKWLFAQRKPAMEPVATQAAPAPATP